jgi:hypothetical protein
MEKQEPIPITLTLPREVHEYFSLPAMQREFGTFQELLEDALISRIDSFTDWAHATPIERNVLQQLGYQPPDHTALRESLRYLRYTRSMRDLLDNANDD